MKALSLMVVVVLLSACFAFADDPENVLVYTDCYVYSSAVVSALSSLGWPTSDVYYADYTGFNSAIAGGTEWDIIATEAYYWYSFSYWGGNLDNYVNGDYGGTGMAVVSTFEMDDYSSHSLWEDMGADWAGDIYYSTYSVYVWDDTHDIFNEPNVLAGPFNCNEQNYVDCGDKHDGLDSKRIGVEVAGYTSDEQSGQGMICIGEYNSEDELGPTVLATLCTDMMSDQTTAVQLWENMLYYVWNYDVTQNVQPASLGVIKAMYQ